MFEDPFWDKVARTSLDDDLCWLWQGGLEPKGYGYVHRRDETPQHQRVHRVAYRLAVGPIPAGLCVCHRCDVRHCCRPSHLWLGTLAENIADAKAKGRIASGPKHGTRTHPERIARGERQGSARLTATQVVEIRRLRAHGMELAPIADRFGISFGHVGLICARKRWGWLP